MHRSVNSYFCNKYSHVMNAVSLTGISYAVGLSTNKWNLHAAWRALTEIYAVNSYSATVLLLFSELLFDKL
jgi:hypothetical protein